MEITVDDTVLTVHINPYFLRLNFSHALLEDDASSAQYDPGTGNLTVTLTKAVKGQKFDDLDLLAKLLAPRPSRSQGPLIEVLDSKAEPETEEEGLVNATERLSLSQEQQEILEGKFNLHVCCYHGSYNCSGGK